MLILQNISYIYPGRDLLLDNIYFTLKSREKAALIGNNGTGKSTLLKIIAGELKPSGGEVITETSPYYLPQIFGQFNHLTIAQALGVNNKLEALRKILDGELSEQLLNILNDDWTIEDRCQEALNSWGMEGFELSQKLETLSGGQKTKVFLAGIAIHQSRLVLMDEPSNHLDSSSRHLLYDFIQNTTNTLLIVSHDRTLLNLLDTVYELDKKSITAYGGNFEFYLEQKQVQLNAMTEDLQNKEKDFRKAKEKERISRERQQKLDVRGKKKQEKAGVATIMMNTLRNNAENSTAKLKRTHADKIDGISKELQELRKELPDLNNMKLNFDHSDLHKGKILFKGTNFNFRYIHHLLWHENLNIQITSGERIVLQGLNGSGKTTLLRMILGKIEPSDGTVYRAVNRCVYIDQDYSLINNNLSVYDQVKVFNTSNLLEHELKIRLSRFLFDKD